MAEPPMIFYSRTAGRPVSVLFMEPGSDANQRMENNSFYSTDSDFVGVTSDTSQKVTGNRSIRLNGATAKILTLGGFNSPSRLTGGTRINFYFRFSAFPGGATNRVFFSADNAPSGAFYAVTINGSDKKIRIWDGSFGTSILTGARQIGGDSTAISANTWYRLCISTNVYGVGNALKAYLDGAMFSNVLNHATSAGINDTGFGNVGAQCERIVLVGLSLDSQWYDDIYVDSGESLEDVGPVHITYKLPNSNQTNNFGTAIGNNPTNRWENVNEQPFSDANGWLEESGGPYPVDENYGIQNASTGEVDLSAYSNFPSNTPGVGIRTSIPQGTNLYECGMIIGFNDATSSVVSTMSYAKVSTVTSTGSTPLIFNNGALLAINSASIGGNLPFGSASGRTIWNTRSLTDNTEQVDIPFIFSSKTDGDPFIFIGRT